MAWQTDEINPSSTSPATDISKIINDLAVLKALFNGGTDAEVPNVLASLAEAAAASVQIMPVAASVNSNALTLSINPTYVDFRNATLTSGTVNKRKISAQISVVVPSGATLGTASARQARLYLLAIDNAGTVELAVINSAGGNSLDETGLISTTAISAAATAANVAYSTTARTNVPYRVVGFVDSTQATAGTWATAPSLVQGFGGQAGAAMSSLGYGQTWQNVTGSRTSGTTYYNTTGKPITASIVPFTGGSNSTFTINGAQILAAPVNHFSFVIPPGASYSSTPASGITTWWELR